MRKPAHDVVFKLSLNTRPRRAEKPMPLTNGFVVAVCSLKARCFLRGNSVFFCGLFNVNMEEAGEIEQSLFREINKAVTSPSEP